MGRDVRRRGVIGDEKGQVGQESNLQPAVLETAPPYSSPFNASRKLACFPPF